MRFPTPPSGNRGAELRSVLEGLRVKIIKSATDNVGLKVMSLGLAISIWALLQSEQVVEQRTRVRVRYTWPEDLVRVDEVPRWVSITVSGPQGRVRAIERRNLSMRVDLSDAEKGVSTIDYSERQVKGLPDNLKVTQTTPPMAEVELDAKIRQTVRVRPSVIGEPAEGWKRGTISVEPSSVEIEGPESLLKELSDVSTDIVNISGRTESIEAAVGIKTGTSTLNPTVETPVTVRVAVEALVDNRTFTEVPVMVDNGWTAEPAVAEFVTVHGPVREINDLKAERVRVMLTVPDPEKAEAQTIRWRRRNADTSEVAVFHGGDSEEIIVDDVGPVTFTVRPTAAPEPDSPGE
jgi:YbbR domain-containing protein